MDPDNEEGQNLDNNSEYNRLATNTFYSFFFHYGSHFFTFVYSFLLARLFTDTLWGFLIIATSFITIIETISSLLPPGLNYALNYYIPRHLALNEKSEIKSLIKNVIKLKMVFLIPIFLISLLIFNVFAELFKISLKNKVSILYILSPLIIINSLNIIFYSINRGFNKFNYNFYFLLIKNAIHIIPLLIFFIYKVTIDIEIAAWIVLLCEIAPFVLNIFLIYYMLAKIKTKEKEDKSFKNDIKKTINYGNYTGLSDFIDKMWKDTQIQGIGTIKSSALATGYVIGVNYQTIASLSVKSFSFPLLTSFSGLNVKENYELVDKIYRIAYSITLFLLLIISGILFFAIEFVLDFVFLESRLIYSNFLRLLILASIFQILGTFIQTYLSAKHMVKLSLSLKALYMVYYIPLFFIGLIYFGVEGAIILGLILGNILSLVIQIIVTYKIGKIRLNIKRIILQYLIFFISLGITTLLKNLFFKEASYNFILGLGLSLFKNFDFLSIGTFILLFFLFNLALKIVTDEDINLFKSYFIKDRFIDKIIIKGLNLLKKFTRK